MKVLHINTYNTGGAAAACLRIHKSLMYIGVDSKVLLRNKTDDKVPQVFETWEDLGVLAKANKVLQQKVEDKKQRKLLGNELKELYSLPSSIWDITKNKHFIEADVIHLHWVAGFIDYASFFEACNKKVVWTLHDYGPFSEGFHYPVFPMSVQFKELNVQHIQLKKKALKDVKLAVVSPTHFLAEEAQSSEVFLASTFDVIPNPVPKSFQYLEELKSIKKEQKRVLFVAQDLDYERKGIKILLETIALLSSELIEFCAVGDTAVNYGGIELLGSVSNEEELCKIYAEADVLVVPSFNDNFPNCISEAHCSGTPVVAFEVGGIPEMVNNSNGVIVQGKSAESLADGIKEALSVSWDHLQISLDAYKNYDEAKCANAYLKLYRKL